MRNARIRVLLPVALADVLEVIAPSFEMRTGCRLDVEIMLNPEIPRRIARGGAWAVAISNPVYIAETVSTGACDAAIRDLGRAPLALAAPGDSRDVSSRSSQAVAAALRNAERIAITNGGTSGAQFERLSDALGIGNSVRPKTVRLPGGGPMAALLAGDVDLAALPLTNIAPVPDVRAVAICGAELDVHIDMALCLHRDADAAARSFADWLVDPGLDGTLRRLGLLRAPVELTV